MNLKSVVVPLLAITSIFAILFVSSPSFKWDRRTWFFLPQFRSQKTILLWTPYFRHEWPDMSTNCNCVATSDRNQFEASSAIIFHWRDFNLNDVPAIKLPNEKYVLYNQESPCNTGINNEHINWFDRNIDWYMTYRNDSDIYAPYAWKLNTGYRNHVHNLFAKKKKMAAWFVSNCNTCSKRELFVEELAKYISVDVYGYCGQFKCGRKDKEKCYKMIENEYKFYLSFENSICKDYITEKLFNILNYNIIPIVLGPSDDYQRLLPDNSYIDALEFKSPKNLAMFMMNVSKNESLYNSYFEWKNHNSFVDASLGSYLCNLCDKLDQSNDYDTYLSGRRKFQRWWYEDAHCTSWEMSLPSTP